MAFSTIIRLASFSASFPHVCLSAPLFRICALSSAPQETGETTRKRCALLKASDLLTLDTHRRSVYKLQPWVPACLILFCLEAHLFKFPCFAWHQPIHLFDFQPVPFPLPFSVSTRCTAVADQNLPNPPSLPSLHTRLPLRPRPPCLSFAQAQHESLRSLPTFPTLPFSILNFSHPSPFSDS